MNYELRTERSELIDWKEIIKNDGARYARGV